MIKYFLLLIPICYFGFDMWNIGHPSKDIEDLILTLGSCCAAYMFFDLLESDFR